MKRFKTFTLITLSVNVPENYSKNNPNTFDSIDRKKRKLRNPNVVPISSKLSKNVGWLMRRINNISATSEYCNESSLISKFWWPRYSLDLSDPGWKKDIALMTVDSFAGFEFRPCETKSRCELKKEKEEVSREENG